MKMTWRDETQQMFRDIVKSKNSPKSETKLRYVAELTEGEWIKIDVYPFDISGALYLDLKELFKLFDWHVLHAYVSNEPAPPYVYLVGVRGSRLFKITIYQYETPVYDHDNSKSPASLLIGWDDRLARGNENDLDVVGQHSGPNTPENGDVS